MNTQRVEETAEDMRDAATIESRRDGETVPLEEALAAILPTPPPIPLCESCGWEHDSNEPCEPVVKPDGAEVWDKDSIPFDVALEVVKRGMMSAIDHARVVHGLRVNLSLMGLRWIDDSERFNFFVNGNGVLNSGPHESIDDACRACIDARPKRIAQLKAELAKLEKEGA
jgi:hypothetical protein